MQRTKLREWIKLFNEGAFESGDRRIQIEAGWYDWFCKDTSLKSKTVTLGSVVQQIKDGGKVDLDKSYVFFKNNCPLNGPLYDDFRICSLETGDVNFTVQFDCCWGTKKYTVYGRTPDGEFHSDEPLFETDYKSELVEWLNTAW